MSTIKRFTLRVILVKRRLPQIRAQQAIKKTKNLLVQR